MDILGKIPEEHILARTRSSNYPEVPDVEYPSSTYPPLENYKLGPEDFYWAKLEDEYVYIPQVYGLDLSESGWNSPLSRKYCKVFLRFLPGQPWPEVEGKLVSTKGKPIPYRVCFGVYDDSTNRCIPLKNVKKVVFKPDSVATVLMTPEPHLILEGMLSKIVRVVTASEEPVYFYYSYGKQRRRYFVINGKNDHNLAQVGRNLAYRKYYDWEPEWVSEFAGKKQVYVPVKDKRIIDLLNETVTWIESAPKSADFLNTLQEIIREGMGDKVIAKLELLSPIGNGLIEVQRCYWPQPPDISIQFPTVTGLRVDVPCSDFPHIMFYRGSTRMYYWVYYLDPQKAGSREFLLEKLLLKARRKYIGEKDLISHQISTLIWLCEQQAPLDLALEAWEEILQSLNPEEPEHLRMQNLITFEKVWKKLTQEAPTP